jgi:hypothetical protein
MSVIKTGFDPKLRAKLAKEWAIIMESLRLIFYISSLSMLGALACVVGLSVLAPTQLESQQIHLTHH